jgi:probable O-glycosylation ligase (exosortase A-associated)
MKGLLFTYALTYGGAVASLLNPFYGLLIYICFATLRPELLWHWSVPQGNYSRIIAIALLAGWAMKGFGNWNFHAARPIVFALIAYWCCILISAVFAANQEVAWNYVELHTKILLPVLVGITLIDTVGKLRALAWVLVGSLGFLAFECNLSYLQGGGIYAAQFRDSGMGGMDNNSFCIAMALGAGLSFFLGIAETRWPLKAAAFASAAMMVHVPMFGQSRGGMLSLLVLGIVSFFMLPKRPLNLALYAAGILVALTLAGADVWNRFETVFAEAEDRDTSAQSRLDIWADGWDVMQKYPLTGAGPDHWPLLAESYGWPRGKEMHSIWVNCGAELGFSGLGCLIGLYAVTVLSSIRLLRSAATNSAAQHAARMAIAGIAGFAIAGSFVALDALEPPYHTVLLGAAAVKLASQYEQVGARPSPLAENSTWLPTWAIPESIW